MPDYVGDLQGNLEVLRDCNVRPKTTNIYRLVKPTVLPSKHLCILKDICRILTSETPGKENYKSGTILMELLQEL